MNPSMYISYMYLLSNLHDFLVHKQYYTMHTDTERTECVCETMTNVSNGMEH